MSAFDAVDEWYREKMRHVRVEHPSAESLRRETKRERARVGRAVRREEQGELRAFCVVMVGADGDVPLRMRCRQRGAEVVAERPCFYVPGKWRAAWRAPVSSMMALRPEVSRFNGLRREQVAAILVERDRWLDEGAPRRTRLPVL